MSRTVRTAVIAVVAVALVAAVGFVVLVLPGGPEFADLQNAFRIGGR